MTKRLFDLNFGMFVPSADNSCIWFNGLSFETPLVFELVGVILGLAIYNNIILDIKLSDIIYKKLLNEPIGIEDL